jgi:hypothetical protein
MTFTTFVTDLNQHKFSFLDSSRILEYFWGNIITTFWELDSLMQQNSPNKGKRLYGKLSLIVVLQPS